jgi:hypothetical protein
MRIGFVMPSVYKERLIMGNVIVSYLPSWKRIHTSFGDGTGRWWIRLENRLMTLGRMINQHRSGELHPSCMLGDPKNRGPTYRLSSRNPRFDRLNRYRHPTNHLAARCLTTNRQSCLRQDRSGNFFRFQFQLFAQHVTDPLPFFFADGEVPP